MIILALNLRHTKCPLRERDTMPEEGIPDLCKFQHEVGICKSQRLGRRTVNVRHGNNT
jgi:hypothetical protein